MILTQVVDMHIECQQQHQRNIREQVDVIQISDEHIPTHAEKTGHQFMSQ